MNASNQVGPVMQALSAYIASALERKLPAPVVEKGKHHLLDTLAAMVSGSRLPPGRLAISYAQAQGGTAEALVAGSRVVTSAVNAASTNIAANASKVGRTPSTVRTAHAVATAAMVALAVDVPIERSRELSPFAEAVSDGGTDRMMRIGIAA